MSVAFGTMPKHTSFFDNPGRKPPADLYSQGVKDGDREGYRRGYSEGYADAVRRILATAEEQIDPAEDGGLRNRTMTEICREVADKHDVPISWLKMRRRTKKVVVPRQEAMWRCSRETTASLPQIGRFFGGFDHTSVIHNVRKWQSMLDAGKVT